MPSNRPPALRVVGYFVQWRLVHLTILEPGLRMGGSQDASSPVSIAGVASGGTGRTKRSLSRPASSSKPGLASISVKRYNRTLKGSPL